MVSKQEILEKFQITGCDNISEDILEKCMELCLWYKVTEEEFVDMWIAFSLNHLDGNLEPTLKTLMDMKRKSPRSEKSVPETVAKKQNVTEKYELPTPWPLSEDNDACNDEDEILGMYGSVDKVSSVTKKRPRSPDHEDKICKLQRSEFELGYDSTITNSPSSQLTPSQKTTQGSRVVATVGPKIQGWSNKDTREVSIKLVGPHLPHTARYMFEVLKTTSDLRTRICRVIGLCMANKWALKNDDMSVTWNVRKRQQQSFRTWGRVCFESEIKQSNQMVLLEGCRKPPKTDNPDAKLWPMVELDVSGLRECYLFPGQIVAVEGLNPSENLFKAEDLYVGNFLPMAKPPTLTNELKIMVAAGPFTQSNDLDFKPLWELMAQVADEEPHILILIGPFLDYNHPKIQSGDLNISYIEFFNRLVQKIKNFVTGKCTQVLMVASSRDVHHHSVYPTMEYNISKQIKEIRALPDPCTLDFDGFRIGITSIDSLMHLGREEVALKQSGTDKLSRLGNYILNQACFYPLYPPAKEINIDTELWANYAFMKEKPHLLILPSDMRYFCKYVNETMILNPERLSKRIFSRINVRPGSESSWSNDNLTCEIIKM